MCYLCDQMDDMPEESPIEECWYGATGNKPKPKTLDELLEEGKVKFKDIDMPKEKKSWWSW